jgi:hypothetical protein
MEAAACEQGWRCVLTKPFNSIEFIGEGWTVWKGSLEGDGLSGEEEVDSQSFSLTEVDLAAIVLKNYIGEDEKTVGGEEVFWRAKRDADFVRFGSNVFLGLWLEYEADKEKSAVEFLYQCFCRPVARAIKQFLGFSILLFLLWRLRGFFWRK